MFPSYQSLPASQPLPFLSPLLPFLVLSSLFSLHYYYNFSNSPLCSFPFLPTTHTRPLQSSFLLPFPRLLLFPRLSSILFYSSSSSLSFLHSSLSSFGLLYLTLLSHPLLLPFLLFPSYLSLTFLPSSIPPSLLPPSLPYAVYLIYYYFRPTSVNKES